MQKRTRPTGLSSQARGLTNRWVQSIRRQSRPQPSVMESTNSASVAGSASNTESAMEVFRHLTAFCLLDLVRATSIAGVRSFIDYAASVRVGPIHHRHRMR